MEVLQEEDSPVHESHNALESEMVVMAQELIEQDAVLVEHPSPQAAVKTTDDVVVEQPLFKVAESEDSELD